MIDINNINEMLDDHKKEVSKLQNPVDDNMSSEIDTEVSSDIDKINIIDKEEIPILFSPQIEIFEPFGAHVDASRTNMSVKQLLQLIISDNCDIPFILGKNYKMLTDVNSPFVQYAPDDGVIIYNNYEYILYNYMHF